MKMSDESQQTDLFQTELESMSLREDSHAKTSLSPGIAQESPLSVAGYGQSAPVCLGTFDPHTPSLKTSQTCLMEGGGDWFKRVLWDISSVGYDAEWHCIPASAIGAHHHRDRIWIVAYPQGIRLQVSNQQHGLSPEEDRQGAILSGRDFGKQCFADEPSVGRVANGVPARSHRLRCLGNAVVPQIPELIGRQIMEAERGRA